MASTRAVLNELIAERARLDRAIDALRELSGIPKTAEAAPRKTTVKRGRKRGTKYGQVPAAVLRFLSDTPGAHQIGTITDGITAYGINGPRSTRYINVYSALHRFAQHGKVEKRDKSWQVAGGSC